MSTKQSPARNLNVFGKLTDAAFNKRTKTYIDNGNKQIVEFQDWVGNAFARYMESGDVSHLNNLIDGSLAIQRFRTLIRVAKPVACHEYDTKARKFVGKIDKEKKAAFIEPSEDDADTENWEAKLIEYFAKEDEHQEDKPKHSWDVDKAILQLVTKAGKEGVGGKELAEKVVAAIKSAASA